MATYSTFLQLSILSKCWRREVDITISSRGGSRCSRSCLITRFKHSQGVTNTHIRKSSCSDLIKGNQSRSHPGKVQSPCYQSKYKINKQTKQETGKEHRTPKCETVVYINHDTLIMFCKLALNVKLRFNK